MIKKSAYFADVSRLVGDQAAFLLFEHFRWKRLYVPVTITPANQIAALIGVDLAKRLSAEYGGDFLEIPGWVRKRYLTAAEIDLIRLRRAQGFSVEQICREFRVSRRTVYYYLHPKKVSVSV